MNSNAMRHVLNSIQDLWLCAEALPTPTQLHRCLSLKSVPVPVPPPRPPLPLPPQPLHLHLLQKSLTRNGTLHLNAHSTKRFLSMKTSRGYTVIRTLFVQMAYFWYVWIRIKLSYWHMSYELLGILLLYNK